MLDKHKDSIYKKSIAISIEDLNFIKEIKGKKSSAGKLREIINFYKLKNKLNAINLPKVSK